jgi:hypothetical protein
MEEMSGFESYEINKCSMPISRANTAPRSSAQAASAANNVPESGRSQAGTSDRLCRKPGNNAD